MLVRMKLTLRSPLSVDECGRRLADQTVRTFFGSGRWQDLGGDDSPELYGRIGPGRRVRLTRPTVLNTAYPKLVGVLEANSVGGTTLRAQIRHGIGWPRSTRRHTEDIDFLVNALGRIGGFVRVPDE